MKKSRVGYIADDVLGNKPKQDGASQLDPNTMYYTSEMFARDGAQFILVLLLDRGLVTEEDINRVKKDFMADQNRLLIEAAKTNQQLTAILLELQREQHKPREN